MSRPSDQHVFTGEISFAQLASFSHAYMFKHVSVGTVTPPDDTLIYVTAEDDHIFRVGVIDKDDAWVAQPQELPLFTVHCCVWGNWLGYSSSTANEFKWQSCNNSTMTAHRIDDDADGEARYIITCRPPAGRVWCGFRKILEEIRVWLTEVDAAPAEDATTSWWAQPPDTEPDWCSVEPMLERPKSLC